MNILNMLDNYEAFRSLYKAEEDAKKTTETDNADSKRIAALKQVEAIEQYITSLYKARMDYIDNMSKKYEGIVTGATALITGDKSKENIVTGKDRKSVV